MTEIGIRELRADLPAVVRRAAAGEVTTVTVNGRPTAVLAPLSGTAASSSSDVATLVATLALVAPRRGDHQIPDTTVTVWRNVRLDRLLTEIR